MKEELNVVVVAQHVIITAGIRCILENSQKIKLAGIAENISQVEDLLENDEPDVILISFLPQTDFLEILHYLSRNYPKLPFVVMDINSNEYLIIESVIKGASAIVWGETGVEEFINMIIQVSEGGKSLHVPRNLVEKNINAQQSKSSFLEHIKNLTQRESQVLGLFANGKTYKEIGFRLGISPRTVESHKKNILRKLHFTSLRELVHYRNQHGIF